ncbi:hypothetical protein K438DRAFT_1957671 [Mycena galopus ATCC 62051]|nr:hypothetical protein K438DRAFT_1957671 [Mycena galopus ATCC 62051]
MSIGRYTQETIQAYLDSLRKTSADLDAFTSPLKCTSLLFPSLLKSSIQSIHAPTGQYRYRHMGRPIFSAIMSEVQRLDANRQAPIPVALVGTSGSGKTHLLSALASFLFAQGKRVVFLPECWLIEDDTLFWLKLAFALPFADLPHVLEKILQFRTIDEFIEFTRDCREDIYFLVDGFDQLHDLKSVICALTSRHFHIYTTYALDTSPPTSRKVSWIRIPSGLSSVEFAEWTRHNESQLPWNLNKVFMEYHTGAVPSLLRLLFKFAGEEFSDICPKLRMDREFQVIADNIVEFNTVTVESGSAARNSRYRMLMSACLTETIPEIRSGSNTALYDPRYFYFDHDDRGHCICGLGRETILNLLRSEDLGLFTSDAWYSAVRSGIPSIRDSAILQICLTRMSVGGLTQADAQGNAMRICTFRQDPNFGWMFEEAWKAPRGMTSFLCIPGPEVFMLNAVILRISPNDKTAHLIPVQITSTLTCIELATRFFAIMWHKWENAIKEEGFRVVNTFVAIDSLTAESTEISAKAVTFREKVKFVSPEYSVRNLNVGVLDSKLGRILQGEKYQSPSAVTPK